MSDDRFKLDHPRRIQEMTKKRGYHKEEKQLEPRPIEKAVAAFRQRIAIGNRHLGRRMRYCGLCGVGVGLMTREQFAARCIWREKVCPKCGEIVHIGRG